MDYDSSLVQPIHPGTRLRVLDRGIKTSHFPSGYAVITSIIEIDRYSRNVKLSGCIVKGCPTCENRDRLGWNINFGAFEVADPEFTEAEIQSAVSMDYGLLDGINPEKI